MAADIDRLYRLEEEGYRVDYSSVPGEISPMNRIIVAERRRRRGKRNKQHTAHQLV